MIRSLLRPSDGDHEKFYRIVELFILITGLNICNLGLGSSRSRVADPARALLSVPVVVVSLDRLHQGSYVPVPVSRGISSNLC